MTVDVSPGAPWFIIYTATQGEARDELWDHTKERLSKCDPDEPS